MSKKSKKQSRVSWPPGPKLCQIKLFRKDDYPAKVGSTQPQGPDLPPGFEGQHYAVEEPNIRRIKWKQPLKFVFDDLWRIKTGNDSRETLTENLRISEVMEATYPHPSAVPSRPFVSRDVETESFDDSKTLTIPTEQSLSSEESDVEQDQPETELPCPTEKPVSGGLDLGRLAAAAFVVLKKTKEQGSMVDPDLLIKILKDPEMIKNLLEGKHAGISSETKTEINNPESRVPRHVTAPPTATMPLQPLAFTNPEQRRASPPNPGYRNSHPPNPRNGYPMPVSRVNIAQQPSLPARLPSSSRPMDLNLQGPRYAFTEPMVIMNPGPQPDYAYRTSEMHNGFVRGTLDTYPMNFNRIDAIERPSGPALGQLQPNSTFPNSEMHNVHASTGFPTRFDGYPPNVYQIDTTERARSVTAAQPMRKSVDYLKNLIKEHGTDKNETNQYHSQSGMFNGHIDNRFMPNFEDESQMAKRMKFERYEKYGY